MKKLLFYIGLLVLIPNVTQLQAQTYQSVLDNNSFVQFTDLNIFVDKKKGGDYDDDPYYLGTAKSLDSLCFQDYKLYKRYLYKRYTAFFCNGPDEWKNGVKDVYLRHNEDNSKLYARCGFDEDWPEYRETLIYDISLNKGDSFPTRVFYIKNYGGSFEESYWDTTLIVDSVYYVNGRKIVELNYYQKLGPLSQQYRFIEGIGPNYGIHPLNFEFETGYHWHDTYSFACMIRAYNKYKMTYDFVKGALPVVSNNTFYSVFGNYGWGHYMAKGEIPAGETDNDPYYTAIEKGPDSLVFIAKKEYKDYTSVELKSTFSDKSYFFSQTSSCTRVFAKMENEQATDSILIYNIGLNKGDTFNTTLYIRDSNKNWSWKDTTLIVDTVFYKEGRKMVKFNYWQTFGPYSQYYMFIEGIGPTFGLFPLNQQCNFSFGCLTSVWFKYYFEKYVSTPQEETLLKGIEIFPNPANNWLHIKGIYNNSNAKIAIYNYEGKCMTKQDLQPKINISQLTPGIYIISVKTQNTIYNYKFIKQ